ncbi:hypothetical protein [Microbacterium kunmingense]|uniref:hypothetical protein n=1 Tax=Microbacterium kunmingense TaxID=2915939 RepID=UPI002005DE89|nr:hypothetical protein [Microbacterium kunmingense]
MINTKLMDDASETTQRLDTLLDQPKHTAAADRENDVYEALFDLVGAVDRLVEMQRQITEALLDGSGAELAKVKL